MQEDERMGVRFVRAAMVILIIGSGVSGFALAQENTQSSVGELKKDCPSEEACGLWEEFKAKYSSNYSWQVKWHGNRNSPHWIDGFYTLGTEIKDKSDAENIATDIITNSKGLLKINDVSDLKLHRTMEDKWTFIPEYDQYYKDIPVYGGEVRVILNKNNVFSGITNTFYPDINTSTKPKITKKEAIRIAENEVKGYRRVESVELYILPQTKDGKLEYHLTWRTYFKGAYFFIDAVNGEIIHKEYTVVADGGISVEGAVNDKITNKKDTVVATPAQNEGSVNSSSAIFVGLAALAIATTLIIIWRYRK